MQSIRALERERQRKRNNGAHCCEKHGGILKDNTFAYMRHTLTPIKLVCEIVVQHFRCACVCQPVSSESVLLGFRHVSRERHAINLANHCLCFYYIYSSRHNQQQQHSYKYLCFHMNMRFWCEHTHSMHDHRRYNDGLRYVQSADVRAKRENATTNYENCVHSTRFPFCRRCFIYA